MPEVIVEPLGAADEFSGVIDLIASRQLVWDASSLGKHFEAQPIQPERQAPARESRARLVECVANHDDVLADRFLSGGEIDEAELRSAIRKNRFRRSCSR